MKLVLLGPPGAGKGTQAARLENYYSIPHISTGDIFRKAIKNETELGQKAKQYLDQGKLVPDEVTNGIVKERLAQSDCKDGFILDGFPRTVNQAEALSQILNDLDYELDAAVNIKVNDDEVVKRLSGRRICDDCGATYHVDFNPPQEEGVCDQCGGELYQRDDDTPDTIKERLEVYYDKTAAVVDYYKDRGSLLKIDGEQSLDEVFADLKENLKEI
ncbi:adenylate kinase [Halanaerobacter jeridensis]|uniref:Adenylate kinase n=1 Tax=Halanaerobacter jeridensis TaxID=706427 RepID=A0A939BQ80_9FIRM|nr:adenylate kinase [Halanaerobacter jeridensis]MBM7557813.1 adenylate kinase [Halanaerobacter jeridensis]